MTRSILHPSTPRFKLKFCNFKVLKFNSHLVIIKMILNVIFGLFPQGLHLYSKAKAGFLKGSSLSSLLTSLTHEYTHEVKWFYRAACSYKFLTFPILENHGCENKLYLIPNLCCRKRNRNLS